MIRAEDQRLRNGYPTLFSVIRPDIDDIDSLQQNNKNPRHAIWFWGLKIDFFNICIISIGFYYDSGGIWQVPQPGLLSFTKEIIVNAIESR